MNLLILKSNIRSKKGVANVSNVLDDHPHIDQWTVDLDDCDHVLRIKGSPQLNEEAIRQLIEPLGFYCEDLPE